MVELTAQLKMAPAGTSFFYGDDVRRTRCLLPARFLRPLPTLVAPNKWSGPPIATVVDRLETGREGMRESLLEGLRKMALRGDGPAAVAKAYMGPLLGDRSFSHHLQSLYGNPFARSLHRWLLERIGGEEPVAVRHALTWGLVDCDMPEADDVFSRGGLSPELVAMRKSIRPPPDAADLERPSEDRNAAERALKQALASEDWAAAKAAAKRLWIGDHERAAAYGEALRSLARGFVLPCMGWAFPSTASDHAIEDELDELGIMLAPWAEPPETGVSFTVFGAMERRRRAFSLDAETGGFPVAHDLLLYRLARLTEGLEGVWFSQKAPPEGHEGARESYVLDAYFDGRHARSHAENLGDVLDVEACIKLVNHVLKARRSEWRVAMLVPDDQVAYFVAGPRSALLALHKRRRIRLYRL